MKTVSPLPLASSLRLSRPYFTGALPPKPVSATPTETSTTAPQGQTGIPAKKVKKSLLKRIFNANSLLWAAPLANVIGGPLLIASSFLPGKTQAEVDAAKASAPVAAVIAKASPDGVSAPAPQVNGLPGEFTPLSGPEMTATVEDVNQLKETLKALGWTMCSLGFLGGAVSGLAMGYVSRQPGMVLSSFSNILLVPALLASPDSFATKAAVALTTAPWLTGFANMYRNQYRLKPGEKPREFDMAPLFSNAAMRKVIEPNGDPVSRARVAKERAKYAMKMLGFVGKDQLMIASDLGSAAKSGLKGGVEFIQHPVSSTKHGAKSVNDAWKFMRGKTTEVPELLKPSVAQCQTAAFLLYAGSLPILFLVGSVDSVNAVGKSMFTAGSALANFPMWALGFNKRDNNLILGIPLMIGGTFKMDTDGGMGMMRLGEAGFMNYLRKEVTKSQEETALEQVSPAEPSPVGTADGNKLKEAAEALALEIQQQQQTAVIPKTLKSETAK